MGTRGIYGLRKNGKDKLTYNHYDSYPDWLGRNILTFIANNKEKLNEVYDNIILVDGDTTPTQEQIEACKQYTDLSVSEQSTKDWYCLLRDMQGDLTPYLDKKCYMINDEDFIKDSLFCEYGYIINLDENVLEFYLGFQKTPTKDNRYGIEVVDKDYEYYPCKNVLNIPLNEITVDKIDKIVKMMEK